MTKKQIYSFTSKVYKRLNNEEFIVTLFRSKELQGLCYIGYNLIKLNPRGEILSTMIHEMLHDINPEWEEDRVLKVESEIMQNLSHVQLANLVCAMGKALKRVHK